MSAPSDLSKAPPRPFLFNKHIVVAGLGLASLSFIIALDRAWTLSAGPKLRITVYERGRPHPDPNSEGYSISIRSDKRSGGMQALRTLGVLDEVFAASITGSNGGRGGVVMWDKRFRRLMSVREPATPPDGLPLRAMRVARYILRRALVDALPDWVTQDPRSLRPNEGLDFAGAVYIAATARVPPRLPALIKEDYGVGDGVDGHSLFMSPVEKNSAVWSIGYRASGPRTPVRGEEAIKRKEEILHEALQRGKVCAKPFPSLVKASDPATLMVFNATNKQPIEHAEMAETNVVFIGDANHAVSPFAGNGANMALMDGVDLAHACFESVDFVSAAAAFDKEGIPRSRGAVR